MNLCTVPGVQNPLFDFILPIYISALGIYLIIIHRIYSHTEDPVQTHVFWCAQTGQWWWAAEPQTRSWCSGWRFSSGHETAWISPVSASPAASPGPPTHSQRRSETRLWPAPSQTSWPFWGEGKRVLCVHETTFCSWWITVHMHATMWAYLVSSECVRMCRQLTIIAESLPVREIFGVNVEREAKRHASIQTEAT